VDDTPRAGALLREARRRAGLSQVELSHRAGVAQSVISAYESAARQPSLPTLARLIAATGMELRVQVARPRTVPGGLHGPLGARLLRERARVREIAARHGLAHPRVFGSVARSEETEASNVDVLVDVAPGVGLLGLTRCQRELELLLGAPVRPGARQRPQAGSGTNAPG
jgi:predicted nucleotidyltransferase/DNA-binding XRE family transcriptional regulator